MWDQYASLAAHYYVTGRFAARMGYVPLCGNLMHHAVELLLKCGLIKANAIPEGGNLPRRIKLRFTVQRFLSKLGLADAPPHVADLYFRRVYGHRLKKLWRDFKRCHPTQDLSAFDRVVKLLDPWEDIRYPRPGVAMLVQMFAAPPSPAPSGLGMKGVRTFNMTIEELDNFVERMWTVIGINPEFFKIVLRVRNEPLAVSVYEDDNRHVIYA